MSASSGIEWTDATWNPVSGCTRVSTGCDHCYAVAQTHRLESMGKAKYAGLTILNHKGERHFNGVVRCDKTALEPPLKWKKPKRIFVNSMSDLFHLDVPLDFLHRVFAVMARTPRHSYQILTKRPALMKEYFGIPSLFDWPLENVWLGTSVEDQAAADERIPHLLKCPAVVRFLSCEPLLGPIDLAKFLAGGKIHLVIVGGESGPDARTCDTNWIRSIIGQCLAAGVPCFVKQLGSRAIDAENGIAGALLEVSGQDAAIDRRLRDRKGGDMDEWAEDLCVREMPAGHPASPECPAVS